MIINYIILVILGFIVGRRNINDDYGRCNLLLTMLSGWAIGTGIIGIIEKL